MIDIQRGQARRTGPARSRKSSSSWYSTTARRAGHRPPQRWHAVDRQSHLRATAGISAAEAIGKTASELGIWGLPKHRPAAARPPNRKTLNKSSRCHSTGATGDQFTGLVSAQHIDIDGQVRRWSCRCATSPNSSAPNASCDRPRRNSPRPLPRPPDGLLTHPPVRRRHRYQSQRRLLPHHRLRQPGSAAAPWRSVCGDLGDTMIAKMRERGWLRDFRA